MTQFVCILIVLVTKLNYGVSMLYLLQQMHLAVLPFRQISACPGLSRNGICLIGLLYRRAPSHLQFQAYKQPKWLFLLKPLSRQY